MSYATTLQSQKCYPAIILVRVQLVIVQQEFLFPIVVPITTGVLPGGYLQGIRVILLKNTEKKQARRVCVKNMDEVISCWF